MHKEALVDLTKDTLRAVGEFDTVQVMLVVGTMIAASNLDDLYEERNDSIEEVYGFNGVRYQDLIRFRDLLMSPDKKSAAKLMQLSKVDLWNDSEEVIRIHAAGNLVFQILTTYFYYKMKNVKVIMTKQSILDTMDDFWMSGFLAFRTSSSEWLLSKLVE
jgi:hypothetical protein